MAWCGVEVGGEWGHASNLLIIYDCDLPTSIPYCFHQLMSYVSLTDTPSSSRTSCLPPSPYLTTVTTVITLRLDLSHGCTLRWPPRFSMDYPGDDNCDQNNPHRERSDHLCHHVHPHPHIMEPLSSKQPLQGLDIVPETLSSFIYS